MKSVVRRVCIVLVALAVMTSVASADQARVYYDYATTGIGTGSGIWSVTVDSGQIPNPAYPDVNDPNVLPYLDPNDAVTFMAPMAAPIFTQRDVLLEGDVIPSVDEMPGLVGWANDATDRGNGLGLEWVFYGPNDTVTLHAINEDYTDYTWEVQTILAGHADDSLIELQNNFYFAFTCADNLAGLDVGNGTEWRTVSYWGDVSNGAGHRHSGDRFRNDDAPVAGQTRFTTGRDGGLDADAQGDGMGVSLGFRRADGEEAPSITGSMFFSDVMLGGDVFADPNTISK